MVCLYEEQCWWGSRCHNDEFESGIDPQVFVKWCPHEYSPKGPDERTDPPAQQEAEEISA